MFNNLSVKMKYYLTGFFVLFLCILISCKKEEENHNDTDDKETLESVEAIFDEVESKHKSYFNLAPIELPSYITESDDTMMQKIVELAAFFNSSTVKSMQINLPDYPDLKHSLGKTAYNISSDDEPKPEKECIEGTDLSFCEYTWYENDGKLKVEFTDLIYLDRWVSTLSFDGEDTDGTLYDDEYIQTWITVKDLSYSMYLYYTKFYICDDKTQILWQFENWVEGIDSWLHFDGESKSLAEYYYQVKTFGCDYSEGYHLKNINLLVSYPDGRVRMQLYIYSFRIHSVYLWVEYNCFPDGSWSKTVYNDHGMVEEHESYP